MVKAENIIILKQQAKKMFLRRGQEQHEYQDKDKGVQYGN